MMLIKYDLQLTTLRVYYSLPYLILWILYKIAVTLPLLQNGSLRDLERLGQGHTNS